jgi:hypothetical protein
VHIDASAGPLKAFMKSALGGVMGTYVLLLVCLMCIIINLQVGAWKLPGSCQEAAWKLPGSCV